jgi:hypothetical protein
VGCGGWGGAYVIGRAVAEAIEVGQRLAVMRELVVVPLVCAQPSPRSAPTPSDILRLVRGIGTRALVSGRGSIGYGNGQLSSTSGPNHEPRSQNVELIGCQSVRQWSGFLSLRTVVRS